MAGREGDGVCRAQARAAPAAVLLLPALRSSSSGLGSADRAVARGPVAWERPLHSKSRAARAAHLTAAAQHCMLLHWPQDCRLGTGYQVRGR